MYCLASIVAGQKIVEYSQIKVNEKDKKTKVVNLTEEAKYQCDSLIKSAVGKSTIEVRFPKRFSTEAESILLAIEKSVARVQEILNYPPIEDIRFYLLQKNDVPESYKILDDVGDKNVFLFLFVFSEKKEMEITCRDANDLCRSIYGTIPHELTHGVIGTLLRHNKTRWFHEGLSEFVSEEVSNRFFISKTANEIPMLSLHRKEIRDGLWSWDYEADKINKESMQNTKVPFFLYHSSGYLLKLIIKNSEKRAIVKPLDVLLNKLRYFKETTGVMAGAAELNDILRQYLKVDYKELGTLDIKDQEKFVEEAVRGISLKNVTASDKFKFLYVLAAVDEIPVSDKNIKILLDNVYKKQEDAFFANLAATGIVRRFKQIDSDKILKEYITENPGLKQNSLKKVKKQLEKMSIRPLRE